MAKKISIYGILATLCLILGYVEHLVSLDFIAPGIKIGLANSVALLLLARGDIKGAFAVNITRILLSALLFAAPSTLIFSFSGGIASLIVMAILSKFHSFSTIGISVAGAAVHNIAQLICAFCLLGRGVLYYSPFLIIAALISGLITGFIAQIVLKKIKKISK